MREESKPTGKPVKTVPSDRPTAHYELFSNGELWLVFEEDGEAGEYRCGYVMDPENIEIAIDEHEQEMRILMAEAMAEFGGAI